jgi:hypothetical protein
MADADLNTQHPDYVATEAVRTVARNLYDGAATVKAAGDTYLFQGDNETDSNYLLRSARAVYENYPAKVVNARMGLLFRKAPTRKLPPRLAEFENNVDKRDTSASVFFEGVVRNAQVDGISWVAVDMPTAPEAGFASKGEEAKAQHRPFFESIPAANVIDWEVDPVDNKLLWAVVTETEKAVRETPGVAAEDVTIHKVWTRTTWERYEDDALVSHGENTSGVVPLVPFFGIKNTDFSGWPVTRDIHDHAILIYNKTSDKDWFEYLMAHPVAYVIGPKKPERFDTGQGFFVDSSQAGSAQISLGYLEPSCSGLASIQESIDRLVESIYQIALAQAKKDSAQVQSADSQREDRHEFKSSLISTSLAAESAESQAWQIMAIWAGDTGAIEVSYNRDFDDASIDSGMISIMSGLVASDQLTLKTFLETLQAGEQLPPTFDVAAELAALEQQRAARAETNIDITAEEHSDGQ